MMNNKECFKYIFMINQREEMRKLESLAFLELPNITHCKNSNIIIISVNYVYLAKQHRQGNEFSLKATRFKRAITFERIKRI